MRIPTALTPRRRAYLALGAVAALLGVTGAIQGSVGVTAEGASDQTEFFMPAAQQILSGHPWRAYTVLVDGYAYDGPPLPLILEAIGMKVGSWLFPSTKAAAASGFSPASSTSMLAWIGVLTVPLALGLCALVAHIVSKGRNVGRSTGLFAFALLAISPLLWLNTTTWGHIEEPMMMLLVVGGVYACQRNHDGLGGLLFGLAVMSRTTAVLPVVAFLVILLVQRDVRRCLRIVGIIAAVSVVIMLPFLIANPVTTIQAIMAFHVTTPIGNSVWSLLRSTPLAGIARHIDIPLALAATIGIAVWAGLRKRVRAESEDVWAVLALSGMLVPLVAKMLWPYYFVEPIATLLIWELLTARRTRVPQWRWPVVSLAYAMVSMTLLEFMGTHSFSGVVLRLTGVTNFVCVAAVFMLATYRFIELRRPALGTPSWGGVNSLGGTQTSTRDELPSRIAA